MRYRRHGFALVTLIAFWLCAAIAGEAQSARRARGVMVPQAQAPAPVQQQPAAPQLPTAAPSYSTSPTLIPPATLELMPARPPAVTLQDGALTIVAKNSTLADILQAVSKQTGAKVEIPAGADERVVAQIGPGPVRDVLDSLLMGSKFNYVMLGSEGDSAGLTEVILFAKPGSDSDTAGQAVQARNSMNVPSHRSPAASVRAQVLQQATPAIQETQDNSEEAEPVAESKAAPPEPKVSPAVVSEASAPDAAPVPTEQTEEHHGPPNIRSMTEVLQNMYSQRQKMIEQQQQQQQPPPAPAQQ